MIYCEDCKKLVEEGEKPETWTGEFWGAKFTQTDYYKCCSECGGENTQETEKCPCGEEIRPFYTAKQGEVPYTGFCENCEDSLNDVVKDLMKAFPRIRYADKSKVLERIGEIWDSKTPVLTPMEFIDGCWEL